MHLIVNKRLANLANIRAQWRRMPLMLTRAKLFSFDFLLAVPLSFHEKFAMYSVLVDVTHTRGRKECRVNKVLQLMCACVPVG